MTTTNNLTERAMLARLNVTQWTARKVDKRATAETIDREQASADAGRFNKQLLAGTDAALKEAARIATAARADHYRLTLPWTDDGARILTAAGYMPYTQTMSAHAAAYTAAVDAFVQAYPQAIEDARHTLGSMYNPGDYPAPDAARAKFSFSTSVDPLPSSDDFRVNLSADAVTAIRADLEYRMKQAEADAMRDVWSRLHGVVKHMADQLPKYSAGQIKRFNDSLVDNVGELLDILPALNLSNDPTLTAMAEHIAATLCTTSAQTLRDDDHARDRVSAEAAAIARRMGAYMGQPTPVEAPPAPEPAADPEEQRRAAIFDLFRPAA
jgi:hypothetical protein